MHIRGVARKTAYAHAPPHQDGKQEPRPNKEVSDSHVCATSIQNLSGMKEQSDQKW